MSLGAQQQIIPSLSPGELIRTSGKFPKPTKIPGKTYCKDEIVIRNADSGKGTVFPLLLFDTSVNCLLIVTLYFIPTFFFKLSPR